MIVRSDWKIQRYVGIFYILMNFRMKEIPKKKPSELHSASEKITHGNNGKLQLQECKHAP